MIGIKKNTLNYFKIRPFHLSMFVSSLYEEEEEDKHRWNRALR